MARVPVTGIHELVGRGRQAGMAELQQVGLLALHGMAVQAKGQDQPGGTGQHGQQPAPPVSGPPDGGTRTGSDMVPPSAVRTRRAVPTAEAGPELSYFSENLSFFPENHKAQPKTENLRSNNRLIKQGKM